MESQAKERFDLSDAKELGPEVTWRHLARYKWAIEALRPHVYSGDIIADIGCGTGYGTFLLEKELVKADDVFGVEVGDSFNPNANIGVFIESLEHMADVQVGNYLRGLDWCVVTCPIVDEETNKYHIQHFDAESKLLKFMRRFGFEPYKIEIWPDTIFTSGQEGTQFLGLFRWR